jgi:enoyl-CoA hydratase/carnithine racemase
MASETVLYEVRDGVALITFNRPDRLNAWTAEMGTAYFDRLDEAVTDSAVGAIVVTGAGRGFSAGADTELLRELSDRGAAPPPPDSRPRDHAYGLPKLTIAAINGAAVGMSLVHALYLDLRFAAAGAKLTAAFGRRGLVAENGVSWLLPRLVGTANALDILLSSRVILAEEAVTLGLVNRVYPAEDLLSETLAYARDVAANCSPASIAAMKSQLHADATGTLDEASARARTLTDISLAGPDSTEGLQSYVERRPAAFAPLGKGTDYVDLLEG